MTGNHIVQGRRSHFSIAGRRRYAYGRRWWIKREKVTYLDNKL
jgi:hypothetical protein